MTKLIAIFFSIAFLFFNIANATKKLVLNELPKYTALENAFLSENRKDMAICNLGQNGWKTIFKSEAGLFNPRTKYMITFNLRGNEDSPADAFLHILVRRADTIHPVKDLLVANVYPTSKVSSIKLTFESSADAKDYAFQIHTRKGISCEITDFKIHEGDDLEFVPYTKSILTTQETSKLPTGAKEFVVDLPQNVNAPIVYGKDFGISPEASNVPELINNAINHCKKIGASTLVIPNGVYKINSNVSVNLIDAKDITLDFSGATFIYKKERGFYVNIAQCQRVEIKNWNIDWDWKNYPLASLAEVVSINRSEKEPYLDFKFFNYKKHPNYGQPLRFAMLTPYDAKNKKLGYDGAHGLISVDQITPKQKYCKTQWLDHNTIRVYDNKGGMLGNLNVSKNVRVQHWYYDMTCFNMKSNKHLTLRNINVFSCAGHAFHCSGTQEYWQMLNVNIKSDSSVEERPITTTADHIHFAQSKGFFKMENCEISRGADDCVNFHDNSTFLKKSGERKLTSIQMRNEYIFKKGSEIEILQDDFKRTGVKAKILSFKKLTEKSFEVELDTPLPPVEGAGFVVFSTMFDTRNIILRNCYFHDGSSNGLLILARDITIENCRLNNNLLCALKLLTGYTYSSWCEGYGVDNVVLRNCEFKNSNPTSKMNVGKVADIFAACYMRKDPSEEQSFNAPIRNILIENNKFYSTNGLVAYIASCDNMTIRNNTFYIQQKETPDFHYRGGFYITHSSNISIIDNIYKSPLLLNGAGVYYEQDSVKNLSFKGNIKED